MTIVLNIFVVDFSKVEDAFGAFVSRVIRNVQNIIRLLYQSFLKAKTVISGLAGRAPPVLVIFSKGDIDNLGQYA